jgi:hypothetical protein
VFAVVTAALSAAGAHALIDLALYASPFLVIAGLLLNGRFVGEQRLLARYARTAPRFRRSRSARWRRVAELAFTSALERAPRSLRGPPAELLTV